MKNKISNIIKKLEKSQGREIVQSNLDIVYKEIFYGYKHGGFSNKDMAEYYKGLFYIKENT